MSELAEAKRKQKIDADLAKLYCKNWRASERERGRLMEVLRNAGSELEAGNYLAAKHLIQDALQ